MHEATAPKRRHLTEAERDTREVARLVERKLKLEAELEAVAAELTAKKAAIREKAQKALAALAEEPTS